MMLPIHSKFNSIHSFPSSHRNKRKREEKTFELSSDSDEEFQESIKKITTPEKKTSTTKQSPATRSKTTPTKQIAKDEAEEKPTKKTTPKKSTPTKKKVVKDEEEFNSDGDVVPSPSVKKRKTSVTKSPKEEKEEKPAETKKKTFYSKSQHENKTKAKNHGCKTVPIGKDNCLKGKAFVVTGQMESLDREELEDLIKQYGGLVRAAVSGKTDYMIVGDEPGESKLKKAREHKTKQISEDDFLEILKKSNPTGQASSTSSSEQSQTKSSKKMDVDLDDSIVQITKQTIKLKTGNDDQLWVEKYKPTKSSDIIGHNKECTTILDWLKNWHDNLEKETKENETKTKGRKKAASGWFRAAFLSGPPGIGKSTTAALIAKEAGFYNIIEMNASDARSKKAMKEQIAETCLSNNIADYFKTGAKRASSNNDKKHTVLIMDEVDGMSSGDRGGVAELVQIIKQTRVPIICIANDRSKINLKTLITYCLDLKFSRPSKATITKKLAEICKKEQLSIDNNALEYLVESLNNDIRSVLNNLQLINRYNQKTHINYMDTKNNDLTKTSSTDGIFDVVKDVLSMNNKKYNERLEDYHFDSMLVPLFVQQNYINIKPAQSNNDKERMKRLAYAADSISTGDVVNTKIRKEMAFGVMNTHAFYSTIYPSYFVRGSFQSLRAYDKYYQFPTVLGKGSTTTKNYNLLRTIQKSASLKASANTVEMLDYLPLLSKTLLQPLISGGKDSVDETIEAMDEYEITRDDLEFMCELSTFKGKNVSDHHKDWFSQIDTKTKTAFTRQFNKSHKGFNKVSAAAALSKVDDEDAMEDESEEDELKVDKFITKMKNTTKLEAFEKKREKADKKTEKKTTKSTKTKVEASSSSNKKPLTLKKK